MSKTVFEIQIIKNPLPNDAALYKGFYKLHADTFSDRYTKEVEKELISKTNALLLIAHNDNTVMGFKLGYEDNPSTFYSWTGAVTSDARQKGVGSALMQKQHEWCKEHGYKRIQTKTKNKWRDMIILNIRHGFDIIGSYTDERGEPKLILEKKL